MRDFQEPASELNEFARALGGLKPAAPTFDRDALLFQAGVAASESRVPVSVVRFVGPVTLAVSAAASLLVGLIAGAQLWPRTIERFVEAPRSAPNQFQPPFVQAANEPFAQEQVDDEQLAEDDLAALPPAAPASDMRSNRDTVRLRLADRLLGSASNPGYLTLRDEMLTFDLTWPKSSARTIDKVGPTDAESKRLPPGETSAPIRAWSPSIQTPRPADA